MTSRRAGETMLEVISKGSTNDAHPVPLLFVHGAFSAAEIWDEGFLDFFADRGHHAVALSLRGHGGSPTSKALRKCTIADYVHDVTEVVATLPTPPVLIGHSMGGFVIQKYLEREQAPAAVLIASTPPRGQHQTLLRLMKSRPGRTLRAMVTQKPSALFDTPDLVRESFFSARTPQDTVADALARLQEESPRALLTDMAVLDLVKTRAIDTPMLVVGAENDALYPPHQVHATARAYRTHAHIVPGAGHVIVSEPEWPIVAATIGDWLQQRGL